MHSVTLGHYRKLPIAAEEPNAGVAATKVVTTIRWEPGSTLQLSMFVNIAAEDLRPDRKAGPSPAEISHLTLCIKKTQRNQ
jgi:hypothetical protein